MVGFLNGIDKVVSKPNLHLSYDRIRSRISFNSFSLE